MHENIYAALPSYAFQALANVDPVLYYGLISAEAEESILDSLACQKSGPFAGIGTQSLTIRGTIRRRYDRSRAPRHKAP